jgi:methionyl-tRNA formyltransferase
MAGIIAANEKHRDSDLWRRLQHGGHGAHGAAAELGSAGRPRGGRGEQQGRCQGPGLCAAQGIATEVLDHKQFASREAFDAALAERIDRHDPALVVLAGFMRILTPGFVAHYAGRLINIHPSLLPAFTGLHTHQRAIDAGCKFAGCTVHR